MEIKNFGLFFLLLSIQLHPLLAFRQKYLPNPFITTDFNQEDNITCRRVAERSLTSENLGDDGLIIVDMNRLGGGGFGGIRGAGSFGGIRGGGSAFGGRSGGAKSSTSKAQSGAVPLAAGAAAGAAVGAATGTMAMNHLTSNNSNGAYLNYVSFTYV